MFIEIYHNYLFIGSNKSLCRHILFPCSSIKIACTLNVSLRITLPSSVTTPSGVASISGIHFNLSSLYALRSTSRFTLHVPSVCVADYDSLISTVSSIFEDACSVCLLCPIII
nr:MAG TPA: hypothetical protein [Caudoviricetes sp.]